MLFLTNISWLLIQRRHRFLYMYNHYVHTYFNCLEMRICVYIHTYLYYIFIHLHSHIHFTHINISLFWSVYVYCCLGLTFWDCENIWKTLFELKKLIAVRKGMWDRCQWHIFWDFCACRKARDLLSLLEWPCHLYVHAQVSCSPPYFSGSPSEFLFVTTRLSSRAHFNTTVSHGCGDSSGWLIKPRQPCPSLASTAGKSLSSSESDVYLFEQSRKNCLSCDLRGWWKGATECFWHKKVSRTMQICKAESLTVGCFLWVDVNVTQVSDCQQAFSSLMKTILI